LSQGGDGNLYGVAGQTVFQLTLSGTYTSIFSFNNTSPGLPTWGVKFDKAGNLYGTATGGSGGFFEITPAGTSVVDVPFGQSTSTAGPNTAGGGFAPVIQGADGNFYGTTQYGGAAGEGVVFEVTP
jgi:uncharacterized repeat protein (TIGR03803 family)